MGDAALDPATLPDLSLWDGLQDALKIGRKSRRKKKKRQAARPKRHPTATPSTSTAIKLGSRDEREQNEFRCESCGKSWARYGFFIKHVKKEHDIGEFIASEQKRGDPGAKIRCRFCRGEVAKIDFFDHFWRRHVDQGHPDAVKPCLLCKKTLAGLEKLRWHLKVIHFGELFIEPTQYGNHVSKALI